MEVSGELIVDELTRVHVGPFQIDPDTRKQRPGQIAPLSLFRRNRKTRVSARAAKFFPVAHINQ